MVCAAGQLAICRVKDGIVRSKCVDPPSRYGGLAQLTTAERTALLNWALSEITGQQRRATQALDYESLLILGTGFYRNSQTGEEVTFRLPRPLEDDFVTTEGSQSGSAAPAAAAV